jgi:hypothetical protein
MIVTTIDLLNYLRCRRYAPLDRVSQERRYDKQIIDDKFQEMIYLSGLESSDASLDAEEEEPNILDTTVSSKDLMNEALSSIRVLARNRLSKITNGSSLFEKEIISTPFSTDITLSSRVDFLGDDQDKLIAMTVLPITDKDLKNLKYSFNKDKKAFFAVDLEGIYFPEKQNPSTMAKSNYDDKLKRLTDRHHSLGRHIYHLAFKAFILSRLHPGRDQRHLLATLNHNYIYDGDKNQEGRIYLPEIISLFDMTYLVEKMQPLLEIDLYRMINHIELDDDSRCLLVKNECCRNQPFECQFVDYCFSHLPEEHSILNYFYQHQGFVEKLVGQDTVHDTYDLINEGVVNMEDVPISWLHREKNLMQRYCVENNYTFINKAKVDAYLKMIVYPAYYLDFEAYPSILPRFKGESPYQQSVFQFSVHIEYENVLLDRKAEATQRYYLAQDGEDHRLELIEALIEAIPPGTGSIIVYNQTFEKTRLQELAALFPSYAERLLEMSERLFDLYKAVKNDPLFYSKNNFTKNEIDTYNFYAPSLDGSYSLKRVLPALCGIDYSDYAINNGESAYIHYAKMPKMSHDERQKTRTDLLEYCQMDTYAMYLIKEALKAKI